MENDFNEIYTRIVQKEISLDEGVRLIITRVYLQPEKFGMSRTGDDFKSAVIIKLFESLPRYLANYSNERAFFSTYLYSIILNLLRAEYRDFYRRKAHETSIIHYLKENKQTLTQDLFDEDFSADVLEDNGGGTAVSYCTRAAGRKKLSALHILILALKACYFLNEKQIFRLSKITGCTEEEIRTYKKKLEETMQKRLERYKESEYRLNNSYMMKNRCFLQLMTMPHDSTLFNRLSKKYNRYERSWRSKLRLERYRAKPQPTNSEIAKVLNLQPYQVYQALRYIRSVGEDKKAQ